MIRFGLHLFRFEFADVDCEGIRFGFGLVNSICFGLGFDSHSDGIALTRFDPDLDSDSFGIVYI